MAVRAVTGTASSEGASSEGNEPLRLKSCNLCEAHLISGLCTEFPGAGCMLRSQILSPSHRRPKKHCRRRPALHSVTFAWQLTFSREQPGDRCRSSRRSDLPYSPSFSQRLPDQPSPRNLADPGQQKNPDALQNTDCRERGSRWKGVIDGLQMSQTRRFEALGHHRETG